MSERGIGPKEIGVNMCAFLDMISHSEGTDRYPNEGYQTIVGGGQFTGYASHPKKAVWISAIKNFSTAAGRYQVLKRYAVAYSKQLHLPDFSPRSQDLIAIQQIKEQGANLDIHEDRIRAAIAKCCNIWASFPGAGYNQHENKMDALIEFYLEAKKRYDTAV